MSGKAWTLDCICGLLAMASVVCRLPAVAHAAPMTVPAAAAANACALQACPLAAHPVLTHAPAHLSSRLTCYRNKHRLVYRGTMAYAAISPVCQYLQKGVPHVTLTGVRTTAASTVTETAQVCTCITSGRPAHRHCLSLSLTACYLPRCLICRSWVPLQRAPAWSPQGLCPPPISH